MEKNGCLGLFHRMSFIIVFLFFSFNFPDDFFRMSDKLVLNLLFVMNFMGCDEFYSICR